MFSVVRLIDTVDEAARDRLLDRLRVAATDIRADRVLIEPTLPGSRNGGDVLMHLRLTDNREWDFVAAVFDELLRCSEVEHVNGASYAGSPITVRNIGATIYRTLLLRVQPDVDAATITRFEDDLSLLPQYVRSIHSWQLSRVDSAIGTSPWTHVFEQEFRDLDGLMGPYLMHPIHWAYVDRWFDPECPEVIIRDRVCHSFCQSPESA